MTELRGAERGFIPKLLPVQLFLDMVSSPPTDNVTMYVARMFSRTKKMHVKMLGRFP